MKNVGSIIEGLSPLLDKEVKLTTDSGILEGVLKSFNPQTGEVLVVVGDKVLFQGRNWKGIGEKK